MPPKTRIKREDVLATAFCMAREQGMERLTARNLAQQVGCSTQPIFSIFTSMDECKEKVYELAVEYMRKYQWENCCDYPDNIVRAMINYVAFARYESNLFKVIFDSEYAKPFDEEGIVDITNSGISRDLMIYTHGLAEVVAHNNQEFNEKMMVNYLEHAREKLGA